METTVSCVPLGEREKEKKRDREKEGA